MGDNPIPPFILFTLPFNETMVFCRDFPHIWDHRKVVFNMNGGWDYEYVIWTIYYSIIVHNICNMSYGQY